MLQKEEAAEGQEGDPFCAGLRGEDLEAETVGVRSVR